MSSIRIVLSRVIFGALALGAMCAPEAVGADLSRYRDFRLGSDLATIAKQAGRSVSDATVTHSRPALIQTLTWGPQPLGSSSKAESVQEVVFTFYDGALAAITINYDRYETEGLTGDDMVEAISAQYGASAKAPPSAKAAESGFGDEAVGVAMWEDPEHRFELARLSYGPRYRLTGVLKSLEGPVQAAVLEGKRLDNQEAPQREAARVAAEETAVRARMDKARLANKAKFRP